MSDRSLFPLSPQESARKLIAQFAPLSASVQAGLSSAIADAVGNGGKRFRALLALASGNVVKLPEGRAEMVAAAVEYFHAASLALDDMPCMDDARLRRGQPCVHVAHGEANTILAALSLISRAYLLMELALAHMPQACRVHAHLLVERSLGAAGLSGGQAADLSFSEPLVLGRSPKCQIARVALLKTGGLIRLALLLPAMAGDASEREQHALNRIAVYWSLAYQLHDDIRDITGNPGEDGKTTGRDALLGRPNYVLEVGHAQARKTLERLCARALHEMENLEKQRGAWSCLRHFHSQLFSVQQNAAAA